MTTTTLPANATEVRATDDDSYAAGARIGYLHERADGSVEMWTLDFGDATTDSPAPIHLGSTITLNDARDTVACRYREWVAATTNNGRGC